MSSDGPSTPRSQNTNEGPGEQDIWFCGQYLGNAHSTKLSESPVSYMDYAGKMQGVYTDKFIFRALCDDETTCGSSEEDDLDEDGDAMDDDGEMGIEDDV